MDALRDSLRAAAIDQMDTDGAHDVAHLDRVWSNVQQIVDGEGAGDMRVLVAATYLHDLVNLPKNSPDRTRASTMAAEAAILRDADRLDAIGAIGIARMFCITGQLGTPLYDIEDPFAADRPLDDKRFAMDHWRVKLLGLGDGFITKTAQAEAQKRLSLMYAFLDQLSGELAAPLPDYWTR